MQTGERRRALRFELKLKCRVVSPFRTFSEFAGITSNVSRTGILVRLEGPAPELRLPALRNSARIAMEIPGSASFTPKCLECEATVVRVGAPKDGFQEFGFRIHRMQFRDLQSPSGALLRDSGTGSIVHAPNGGLGQCSQSPNLA